ncbi:DUF397 domain-containing protein [Nocardia rhamnosiphila]
MGQARECVEVAHLTGGAARARDSKCRTGSALVSTLRRRVSS